MNNNDYEFGTVTGTNVSPTNIDNRKDYPVFNGVLKYFPLALLEISKVSRIANEQHNPGEPMHWAKEKSIGTGDEAIRHLMDWGRGEINDTDGVKHLAKFAWRALELLERNLQNEK